MSDTTNAGPVLPKLPVHPDECIADGWTYTEEDLIRTYGLQCWNACAEQVAGPLRERVAELERDVNLQREIAADAVAGGTRILDVAIENGGLSLSLEGGGAQLLAEILAKQYADSHAVNYLQLSFTSQHSAPGESFVVTVQRVAGKTAHELRAEAEADRDRLRAESAIEWEHGRSYTAAQILRSAIRGLRVRKGHELWPAVRNLCGVGSNVAHYLCRWAGRNPDTGADLKETPK